MGTTASTAACARERPDRLPWPGTGFPLPALVLRRRGHPVARLNSGPVEEGAAKPQRRPRWLVHFRVPDLDWAVALVLENGGTTVTGPGWGGGRQVTVRDPDGGLFTLDHTLSPAPGARGA
ncbi:VOC family protein [Streptomyces sp. NPDC096030]|uniref:VOC family protein n=1 Tax=Streptomyces sp. NPDC096030 TaxID=3155423 RepID=UPI0033221BC3